MFQPLEPLGRYNVTLAEDRAQVIRQMADRQPSLLPGGLHPLLLIFCDPTPRSDLGEPWLWGENVYATDGRVLVSQTVDSIEPGYLARIPVPRDPDDRLRVNLDQLRPRGPYRNEGIMVPLDTSIRITPPLCAVCDGRGFGCGPCRESGRAKADPILDELWPGVWMDRWHFRLASLYTLRLFCPLPALVPRSILFRDPTGTVQGVVPAVFRPGR